MKTNPYQNVHFNTLTNRPITDHSLVLTKV